MNFKATLIIFSILFGLQILQQEKAAFAAYAITTSPDGDRLLLCGKANRLKTANRLSADPVDFSLMSPVLANRRFEIDYPAGFPGNYWGINRNQNAYVCLGGNRYNDSVWSLPGYSRSGPFNEFAVTIQGFKRNNLDQRIDVTGDGVVDDSDWTTLNYLQIFSGSSWPDAQTITSVFTTGWNLRARAGKIKFDQYDGDGYPRAIAVATYPNGLYFTAMISPSNSNDCSPASGKCKIWDEFTGTDFSVSPTSALHVLAADFKHKHNKWVAFDAQTDSFSVYDAGLKSLLINIEFVPTFWVLSRQNKLDILGP